MPPQGYKPSTFQLCSNCFPTKIPQVLQLFHSLNTTLNLLNRVTNCFLPIKKNTIVPTPPTKVLLSQNKILFHLLKLLLYQHVYVMRLISTLIYSIPLIPLSAYVRSKKSLRLLENVNRYIVSKLDFLETRN